MDLFNIRLKVFFVLNNYFRRIALRKILINKTIIVKKIILKKTFSLFLLVFSQDYF